VTRICVRLKSCEATDQHLEIDYFVS